MRIISELSLSMSPPVPVYWEMFALLVAPVPSGYAFTIGAKAGEAASMLLRSEEHTSELQSLRHLVCRLLLEKKRVQDDFSRCPSDKPDPFGARATAPAH